MIKNMVIGITINNILSYDSLTKKKITIKNKYVGPTFVILFFAFFDFLIPFFQVNQTYF